MKIGLCGAQGTGKTTLAKAYSEMSGIPYIDAKVGDFLKEIGVDLSRSDMPIVERMKAQLMVAGHIASITEGQVSTRPGLSSIALLSTSWRTPTTLPFNTTKMMMFWSCMHRRIRSVWTRSRGILIFVLCCAPVFSFPHKTMTESREPHFSRFTSTTLICSWPR